MPPKKKVKIAKKASGLTPQFDQFYHTTPKPIIRLISKNDLTAVKKMVADGLLEFARTDAEKASTQNYIDKTMSKEVDAQADPNKNMQFNRKMWVAEISGQIVGCIGLKPTPMQKLESKRSATLHIMSIKATHRRQGIGGLLLQSLEDYCAKVEIQNIRLTTQDNLTAAMPFYEKHGFTLDKKQKWENLELLKYKKAVTPAPKTKARKL